MNKLFVVLSMVLVSSFAFANEVSQDKAVAADMIISQVLTKKLLKDQGQAKMLKALLEKNVRAPYTAITITSVECDAILGGRDMCVIGVVDLTNDGTESLKKLSVTIKNGQVTSAVMSLVAAG